MNQSAFKLYDIRGKYPEEVDEKLAFALGKTLSEWKSPKKVGIAGDIRESTPKLKKYLIDGFESKVEVIDFGEVPVPEFYYSVSKKKLDLGVMITASHLHADENGFKIVEKGGLPLDQSEIQFLKKQILKKDNEKIVVPPHKITNVDLSKDYITALIKASNLKQIKLKLVLDTIRSSTSTIVPILFTSLQAKYTFVKGDHEGNPLIAENRKELEQAVVSLKANLGVIWDSDGDRVAFVDSHGQFIPMSFVVAILGSQAIKDHQGGKVAVDVRAGLVVRDEVELVGGKVEVFPSWHVSLKFAMEADPKIVFAGENSGHYMFKDFFCFDDGLFAALKFIDFAQRSDLEERLKHLKNRYFELPEMNFKISPDRSSEILESLSNLYRDQGNQVSLIDGLTVFGPNFKINLRESATESLLRLNLEAQNESEAGKIIDKLQSLL